MPHRHVHRLRSRSVGVRTGGARPRRLRDRRAAGRRRDQRRARRSRGDAVLAAVPRVRALRQPQDESVPGDPRAAEPRPPAGRHHAAVARRRADPPLHGHQHVRRVHGDAGDRARQDPGRRPAGSRRAVRMRAVDRDRRGDQHRQGRARLHVRRVRRRAGGPRSGRRMPPAGRRADHLRGPVARAPRARPRPGRDGRVDRRRRHGGAGARGDPRVRRRLHVRGHRVGGGDAPGGRVGADGLGAVHGRRRRGQGRGARGGSALSDHRPPRVRQLVRRRQGSRPGPRSSCSCISTASSMSTR